MNAYPVAAPPRRRSILPWIFAACLLGFATLCGLVLIGAGAAAFLAVRTPVATHAPATQTADLFLIHMTAGRWSEASRLVAPEFAAAVAAVGEQHKAAWGPSQGCTRMNSQAGFVWDEHGPQHTQRVSMDCSMKGADGKVRTLSLQIRNGVIVGIGLDGVTVLGEAPVRPGCRVTVTPAPSVPLPEKAVVAPPAERGTVEEPAPVEPPKEAPKKKTR